MKPFKEGDQVEFEHVGRDLEGTVIEILPDKIRVKDTRGYMYRYSPENVRHKGEPKPAEQTTTDSSNTNTNNLNSETMAKKKAAPQSAKAAAPKAEKKNGNGNGKPAEKKASNPALDEQKKKIVQLSAKKHQKIWLLHSLGLEKVEVMQLAGCNAGEISNVRKLYSEKPEKVKAAEALLG